MEYRIQDIVLLFFLYSFLGWCGEVIFAACKEGRFINRGFLNGPICPIYGFGVILVALLLQPWEDNIVVLYFGSAILTTLLELVTGWALDVLFHTRYWDYTGMPLNIGGYVCLPFSFLWGAACVVILKWVHTPLLNLVHRIPGTPATVISVLLCAIFVVDLVATLVSAHKLSQRLSHLTAVANEIHALSDEIGENIAEHTMSAWEKHGPELERIGQQLENKRDRLETKYEQAQAQRKTRREQTSARLEEKRGEVEALLDAKLEQLEALLESNRERLGARKIEFEHRLEELKARNAALLSEHDFAHNRLLEAFPNMVSHHHSEALARLREALRQHRDEK